MNTRHICDRTALNGPKPHSIRMPRMAFDEKLAYVESVLDVMLESRFGPGYSYSCIDRPDHNAADEPLSFLDLIENQDAAWYATGVLGRKLQRPAESKGIRLSPANPTRNKSTEPPQTVATLFSNLSPSNLGRGSPKFSATHHCPEPRDVKSNDYLFFEN